MSKYLISLLVLSLIVLICIFYITILRKDNQKLELDITQLTQTIEKSAKISSSIDKGNVSTNKKKQEAQSGIKKANGDKLILEFTNRMLSIQNLQ